MANNAKNVSGFINVDAVAGASSSGKNFEKLVEAVLRQAAAGDSTTAVVE